MGTDVSIKLHSQIRREQNTLLTKFLVLNTQSVHADSQKLNIKPTQISLYKKSVKCTLVQALRLCTGRTVKCTLVQALRLCTGRTVKGTVVQTEALYRPYGKMHPCTGTEALYRPSGP
jgi:hypothetical protein